MAPKYHLQAFKFTFSFKTDLPTEVIDYVKNWLKNNADYHYSVTEHGNSGVLHMHNLVYTKKRKCHGDIKLVFWRALKKYAELDGSEQFCCIQINAAFNAEWRDKYLQKEVDHTVITDVWPADGNTGVTKYYPDAATQKALEAIGKAKTRNHTRLT